MNRLVQAEIEEIEVMEEEEKQKFRIEDKEQAQWALRKIKALNIKHKETDELAEAEIERIKAWQDKENRSIDSGIAFFEGLLFDYMLKEKKADEGLKSIKLPSGTLRLRKQQPEYIRDDDKLVKWAITVGEWDLVKTKESIDWAALKKDIAVANGKAIHKGTGEVIKHIKVMPRDDKFEVVVN